MSSVMMDRRPHMKLPLEPPQEPLALKFTSLYGSNGAEKDKKILKHLIDHCSHCSSYHDCNLERAYSECSDKLCHYIYWHYRHYWSKHMLNRQTMEECSVCESCTKLYQWMLSHASECLHVSRGSNCCLSLCHEMKKSQHLTNLGKTDHDFIRQVEDLPCPLTSYSTPTSHGYEGTASSTTGYSSQQPAASTIINGTGGHVHVNYTANCDDQRMPGPPAVGTHQSALRAKSSMNLRHPEKSLQHQHHNHSQSSHDLQRPCRCTNGYESHHPAEYLNASAHNSVVGPPNGSIQQPWATHDSRSHNGVTTHHPHLALVTGPQSCATTPSGLHQLTTPTEDPLKMSRQISSASSGYGTGSSTGRQSVTSIFSRDQSYTELIVDEPENSLQVSSTPQRKISAPSGFRERKKIRQQQSRSLTNLEDKIPEYISPRGDQGPCILGEEVRPVVIPEDTSYQPPSLQRQDTDHESRMVSGGLEASIDKSHFQDIMSKRKPVKQKAFEHTNESSPSPPVTKRPLQREESDVSRSKIVMCREGRQTGSSSITKDHYDSILKFQEQHGILTDQSTRSKVINKQQKQAAAMEHHLRRGTMSDVQSDFDTESSTSDIPGSSPLTSGDFSELDQDLTDQDDDKKITSEIETQRTQIKECAMTVEEQVQLINRLKANKKPLSLSMARVPQGGMMKTVSSKQSQGLSLPPEMSPSTYTPSPNPLLSLTPGVINSYTSAGSDTTSTFESEIFSNSTLRDEDNFSSSKYSNEPVTLSSTDGSTLTGGSFEGKFTSMRLSSEMSSCRNEDVTKTVNSPNERIAHAPQFSDRFQDPSVLASSPMDQSERSSNYQYDKMQSEEDSRLQSMEYDVNTSPSPSPPPCLPGKYKLPSSEVQELCKAVDNVKEKYHEDLLRIKRQGEIVKQEPPLLTEEEQQRRIPGSWIYGVDKHGDDYRMYRGQFSSTFPESNFPELERKYYHKALNEQFTESKEEIARDVERRHLLKKHLLGKFHSGHAYREGVDWYRKTKLGKGGQAECYSIQDVRTQLIMALKEEKEDPKTLDEAYVCMKLSSLSNASQNIVDYYCAGMLPKEHCWKRISFIQVFMELMPTCLHAYFLENGPFGGADLHHYGYQLFDALDYLHSKLRIIHCDVKPANLLLDYTAQRIKLTDFGFSQILDQYTNEVQGDENAGTLSYNPPEHYREKRCTFALDIWQAGCTLLTMATTRRPWRHLFMDVVRKGQSPRFVQALRRGQADLIGQQTRGHMYPAFLDDSLKQLLHGCLHPDPGSRLSAQDCVYQLAMADTNMNEQQRAKITEAFGYWRSPPPVLSSYKPADQYVDVYLKNMRHAVTDNTRYSLSPGWLGRVPYHEGMTIQQMEKDILQHFTVMQHLSFKLETCENSPQAIFMKTSGHSVNLNFEDAPPQSLVDRTKAVLIVDMHSS